jgi:hypothetical protein
MNLRNERPLVALGHAFTALPHFERSVERVLKLGFRKIIQTPSVCVVELRGGTHIVMQPKEGEQNDGEPFDFGPDLMYDNIDDARKLFISAGFSCSEISRGSIHDEFWAEAPENFRIHVNSSHTSGFPV